MLLIKFSPATPSLHYRYQRFLLLSNTYRILPLPRAVRYHHVKFTARIYMLPAYYYQGCHAQFEVRLRILAPAQCRFHRAAAKFPRQMPRDFRRERCHDAFDEGDKKILLMMHCIYTRRVKAALYSPSVAR